MTGSGSSGWVRPTEKHKQNDCSIIYLHMLCALISHRIAKELWISLYAAFIHTLWFKISWLRTLCGNICCFTLRHIIIIFDFTFIVGHNNDIRQIVKFYSKQYRFAWLRSALFINFISRLSFVLFLNIIFIFIFGCKLQSTVGIGYSTTR